MPRRRGLTREEIEAQYETAGGFMIPLRMTRRTGLIWVAALGIIAFLALVGGLPGGTGGVDLSRVLEPFPPAVAADPPAPQGAQAVADDAQTMWKQLFAGTEEEFDPATIVVFGGSATTDCGEHKAETEPRTFYCHVDDRLLVDRRLENAYSIAHGYAHHVQEILGITDQIARAADASPSQGGDLWRRHELQADCLAGVWAHRHPSTESSFAAADLPTEPDHFLEPTTWRGAAREEREGWFRRGLEGGDPSVCDSFSGDA